MIGTWYVVIVPGVRVLGTLERREGSGPGGYLTYF